MRQIFSTSNPNMKILACTVLDEQTGGQSETNTPRQLLRILGAELITKATVVYTFSNALKNFFAKVTTKLFVHSATSRPFSL